MKKILITGGTVFVGRYAAEYFAKKGNRVFVLNRNTRPQPDGVTLIEADRHDLGGRLKGFDFDLVIDISAYTRGDVRMLNEALPKIRQYVFISSSAVYPETLPRPFSEDMPCGYNSVWGDYGKGKLEAEEYIRENIENHYIIRPPYLYGPMNNLYREGFIFDCANRGMPCYVPKDGTMPLHFFHVGDLCRFIEILTDMQPNERIYNVGNAELVDINEWTKLCYAAAGAEYKPVFVDGTHAQRSYFPFYDYSYSLDVSRQNALMPELKPLSDGLKESYEWYAENEDKVNKKPYFDYIEKNL